MKASIIDLRYKTNDILAALDRRECITILYRGKPKGTILPIEDKTAHRVCEHEFFGMNAQDKDDVAKVMERLRCERFAL
jgi:hypothetical protein